MVVIGVDLHKRTPHRGRRRRERAPPRGEDRRRDPAGHLELLRWARPSASAAGRSRTAATCHGARRPTCCAPARAVVPVPPKLMAGARRRAASAARATPSTRSRSPGPRCASPTCRSRARWAGARGASARRPPRGPRGGAHGDAEPAALAPPRARPGCEPPARALDRAGSWPPSRRASPIDRASSPASPANSSCGSASSSVDRRPRTRDRAPRRGACTEPAGAPGCGPLTAAKLIGEAAGIERFRSKAGLRPPQRHGPVPVWSGNTTAIRLSRGGNRQLNVGLHRIAITQVRLGGAVGPTSTTAGRR